MKEGSPKYSRREAAIKIAVSVAVVTGTGALATNLATRLFPATETTKPTENPDPFVSPISRSGYQLIASRQDLSRFNRVHGQYFPNGTSFDDIIRSTTNTPKIATGIVVRQPVYGRSTQVFFDIQQAIRTEPWSVPLNASETTIVGIYETGKASPVGQYHIQPAPQPGRLNTLLVELLELKQSEISTQTKRRIRRNHKNAPNRWF